MTDIGSNITVAMITRNEEGAIGKVVGDIQAALPSAEIIIVDSSDDNTAGIAEQMGVTVIRQYPPEGYGPAMNKALRAGTRAVTVTLDCDDTYPVDRIEPMARMVLEDGYDLVDGNRLARKPAAMPWLNYLANWGFAWMASVLFFRRIKDLHSGMRAYRAGLPAELNCTPNGAALPVSLLLMPIRTGKKFGVVDIPYRIRIGESVMDPLPSAWWTLKRILAVRFGGG